MADALTPPDLFQQAVAADQAGDGARAIELLRTLLTTEPKHGRAWHLLGLVLEKRGNAAAAIAALNNAATLRADDAECLVSLGNCLRRAGQASRALDLCRQAAAMAPGSARVQLALGMAAMALDQFALAEIGFAAVARLAPDLASAKVNLAASRYHQGNLAGARAAIEEGLRALPEDGAALTNAALISLRSGDLAGAVATARRAVALHPDLPEAHRALADALLAHGELAEAWTEYEWRWKSAEFLRRHPMRAGPLWQGEPLAGKRLLVWAEQGYGDTIQFMRYLPMLADHGGEILFAVYEPLQELARSLAGRVRICQPSEAIAVDFHLPLMSLPLRLSAQGAALSTAVPYLSADPEKRRRWARQLAPLRRPRIGLVWRGGRGNPGDLLRSVSLEALAPLLRGAAASFVSLQKDEDRAEIAAAGLSDRVAALGDHLVDFSDTAAAMAELDLVLSVDTAALHLAGALGRPAWFMAPWLLDPRWMKDRSDSPWYPTMRIIRQPKPGDWAGAFDLLADALAAFCVRQS